MDEPPARDPDCLFCRIVAGEIPAELVHSDDLVIAVDRLGGDLAGDDAAEQAVRVACP